MKNILKSINGFLEGLGRVRAASHFARTGDYAAARNIMLSK